MSKGGIMMKKRALISVANKDHIAEFAQGLVDLNYEIISTGGTLDLLQAAGIRAQGVDDITGFPEILDGRVKTLHPKIHGGLLADRKSTRLNSSHVAISYAVFCLKKKKNKKIKNDKYSM